MVTSTDKYLGPISSNESRRVLKWYNGSNWIGGPGNTKDTQWDVSGDLTLYDNYSDPYKNMANIVFSCEFDSSTNLAPGQGQFDIGESLGTDPGTAIVTITNGTIQSNLTHLTTSSSLTAVSAGDYLQITSTDPDNENIGNYAVSSISGSDVIVDITKGDGKFKLAESGVSGKIYKITKPSASNMDIQTDLQSGNFTAFVILHAWPSYIYTYPNMPSSIGTSGFNPATNQQYYPDLPQIMHVFEVVPYWLIMSQISTNDIVLIWNYTCKCIIREHDYNQSFGTSGYSGYSGYNLGSVFKNYWDNYYPYNTNT